MTGFWTTGAGRAAWTRRGRSCAPRSCRTCRTGRTPARCRATCTAQAAKLGLLGLGVPEEVGGSGGTFLDALAVTEAFIRGGRARRGAARRRCSPRGIALPHIVASRRRRPDRPLRPADAGRRDDRLAGGHRARRRVRRRRTCAPRPRRDGDHYVVNGAKTFITSGVRADFVTTAVRTGGPGHARRSACWSSTRARPASPSTRSLAKMGWHCSDTAELAFADVRVPAANLVGEENTGFAQIAQAFVTERLALAAHGYGIAARALALTAAHCRAAARPSAGRWLANQVVRHRLVEMHRRVDVARTYTRRRRRAGYVAGREPARRGAARQGARRSRPRRTSATRPSSCTAARATCTGPRWSGTTATPGSWASEEEPPRCSTT